MENSFRITTFLQLGKTSISTNKLNGIAKNHYKNSHGATNIDIFNTITWPYFYKWAPDQVSRGNHWKVYNLQGHQRTWYAGASVSFESVKSVMEYNNLLLRNLGIIHFTFNLSDILNLLKLLYMFYSNCIMRYFYDI